MKVKISEKEFAQFANGTDSFDYTKYLVYPDITIADVLIAFEKRFNNFGIETLKVKSSIILDLLKVIKSWNLFHDNLDWHAKNRPETISFLEDLLL